VLELAAEDELKPNQTKRARRVKAVPRKRVAAKRSRLKVNVPESAGSAHKPRLRLFPIAIKERTGTGVCMPPLTNGRRPDDSAYLAVPRSWRRRWYTLKIRSLPYFRSSRRTVKWPRATDWKWSINA
jgi:hypothetical protein